VSHAPANLRYHSVCHTKKQQEPQQSMLSNIGTTLASCSAAYTSINSVGQDGTKKTGLPINNMKRACKIVMQQDTSEAEEDEEAEECGAGETVLRVLLQEKRVICVSVKKVEEED